MWLLENENCNFNVALITFLLHSSDLRRDPKFSSNGLWEFMLPVDCSGEVVLVAHLTYQTIALVGCRGGGL
jgi:hypothetical protein